MNKPCSIMPRGVVSGLQPFTSQEMADKTPAEIAEVLATPEVIKLSFNESPYGPAPRAIDSIRAAAAGLHLYQDPENKSLKAALAAEYGVGADRIAASSGADEMITLIAQALLQSGDKALMPYPAFGQYQGATLVAGAEPVLVANRADLSIDLTAIAEKIGPAVKVIFLCNPNNPTGMLLDAGELREFLDRIPQQVVVVLDEAYAEYVSGVEYLSGISLTEQYPNLITVRTFSKIYGLAGLRLGYSIAHPQLTGYLERVRNPFNISALAQGAGIAALGDKAFIAGVAEKNARERSRMTEAFQALGFTVCPSQTNFLFVDTKQDSEKLCRDLEARGIVIRPGTNWKLPAYARISLGDREQNTKLLAALQEICVK